MTLASVETKQENDLLVDHIAQLNIGVIKGRPTEHYAVEFISIIT